MPVGSHSFDDSRNALAHAYAHGCQAVATAAPLQLMQYGDDQARPAAAKRVTKRDGAAIDIELFLIDLQFSYALQGLSGKSLVQFDQIDILDAQTGAL